MTPKSESSRRMTCVEGLKTLLSSSGILEFLLGIRDFFAAFALLLLMAASLRMAMAGVLTGVPAGVLGLLGGGVDMVRVTTCMCSPNCLSPLWYCLRRLRNLAK